MDFSTGSEGLGLEKLWNLKSKKGPQEVFCLTQTDKEFSTFLKE